MIPQMYDSFAPKLRVLQEEDFKRRSRASDFRHLEIGDAYDGLWGIDFHVISKDDLYALLEGKTLYTTILGEYTTLIKLEDADV